MNNSEVKKDNKYFISSSKISQRLTFILFVCLQSGKKLMKISVFYFILSVLIIHKGFSEELISKIDIQGNKIVSTATIISKIKIRAGQIYNDNVINEDIKNLYNTGFFENVETERQTEQDNLVLVFKLKEKPVLKKIIIEGQRHIRKTEIEKNIDIKAGSFIDDYELKKASEKIKELYNKRGFAQTNVSYTINRLEESNEADVKFTIEENKIMKIRKITIDGSKTISTNKILKLIKTKKAWLLNRGFFKEEVLDDDVKRVSDFYKIQGFSDVKVNTDVSFEDKGVYVTFKIEEGRRYYIGEIKIEGNKEIDLNEIKKTMEHKTNDVFSEQAVYENSTKIRELYVNKGYIFLEIEPSNFINLETQKVDVTYKIIENEVAYLEKIDIRGNIKTKDKVIRRELRIYPGDRYDGKAARKSKERLDNLGFFDEETRFGIEPGTKPNWVTLVLDVKEAKTGYLSFGGGYSSIDQVIGFIELRQRNFDYKNFSTFTGAGQDLSLYASLGTVTEQVQLSFTNPWIFDIPISFGFDGYKKGHSREDDVGYAFEEDIRGGALRLGREFTDNIKGGVTYRRERVKISDVLSDATQELKDEEGINNFNSSEFNLSFDTRDNIFVPSRGVYFLNNFQVTGGPFGGDKDFLKYLSQVSFYYPLINKSVLELKLRGGLSTPFSNTEKIPIFERFFAGGASTIRGYRERKVGPIDPVTEEPIGGEALFINNVEYTYPLTDFLKMASFFDIGNVWKENNDFLSGDLKSSVGFGIRIKTPIGPVSLDYGWPLRLEPGEEGKEGRFHFNVSRGF